MIYELKIPLATLADHRVVKLPTVAITETVAAWQEKTDTILVGVKKLKHERYQLAMAIGNLAVGAGIASKVDMTGPQLLMLAEDALGLINTLKAELAQYPMQPIVTDPQGVVRFEENPIVNYLATEICDLNKLTIWRSQNEVDYKYWEQLMQLIGYSVSGYGDLSHVSGKSVARADAQEPQK
jgi:hypothetical protein